MKTKKSVLALVGLVLTAIYLIYLIVHFTDAGAGAVDSSEQAGVAIAAALIMPHAFLAFVGAIFNALGYFLNKKAFILTAGILYAVAMVLFIPYFMFMVVQMVLMFVAFAKMKVTTNNTELT